MAVWLSPMVPTGVTLPRLEPVRTYGSGDRSAFARGKEERSLRLTLDLDGLAPSDALDLALELGNHEMIDLTTTRPVGFSTITVGTTVQHEDSIVVRTEYRDGGDELSRVWPAGQWLRSADEHARPGRTSQEETRRRFLLAGAVVGETDGLVLQDTHFSPSIAERANPLTIEQGVALIGLFLRSRGETGIGVIDSSRARFDLGGQYHVGARAALPAAWRWWSACVAAGRQTSGERTLAVAQAVLDRVPRCIRARDEVMYRCLVSIDQSDQAAILYHLDAMLLMMSGAIDATALVANDAHSIGMSPQLVGWRRKVWRASLSRAAPLLHAATDQGTPLRAVIELIALARNTIHGEPLGGVHSQSSGKQMHLVRLPTNVAEPFIDETKALGGPAHWGVETGTDPMTLLDPLRFVQVVLPFAAAALNALMASTEVDLLRGVDPQDLTVPAPTSELFEPRVVRRLQLLMGLGA